MRENYFAPTKPDYKRNQFGAHGRRADRPEQVLRVRRLRRAADDVQGQPFLGSVPSQAFLAGDFSALSTPIRDPLTGLPFPGNIIPPSRFSNFAQHPGADHPGAQHRGANNYTVDQGLHRRRGHGDGPGRPVDQQQHNLFQRFMYYKGSQLQPGRVQLHRTCRRTGRNLARRATPG